MKLPIFFVAAVLAVTGSAAGFAPASAQSLGAKQPKPVPCDCTNCSAEHCPKPAQPAAKNAPKMFEIESWSFGSGNPKGATGLRPKEK